MRTIRIFFMVLVMLVLAEPTAVFAAGSTIPEFNPLCWREQQCLDVRAKLFTDGRSYDKLTDPEKKQINEGFIEESPCEGGSSGEKWGKCLPVSTAKTMIAFGGRREFTNIGDFIQGNYTFALSIAAILAVVMIIVAGFQWVTSGGNSEAITSAKNRIGGALIGLFIAYTSYFILNTISPNLVNLRLPQTWMVRPLPMVPQFCSATPSTTLFALVSPPPDQSKTIDMAQDFQFNIGYDKIKDKPTFPCGSRFLMKDGGDRACFGNVCDSGFVCVNFDDAGKRFDKNAKKVPYNCRKGNVVGIITNPKPMGADQSGCIAGAASYAGFNPSAAEGWESGDITDPGEQEIWAVCKNGSVHELPSAADTQAISGGQQYFLTAANKDIDEIAKKCGGGNELHGFVLTFEMNEDCDMTDETHVIGRNGEDGVDLGDTKSFPLNNAAKLIVLIEYYNLQRFFISADDLKRSLKININAVNIEDVDADKDYIILYNRLPKIIQ